MEFWKDSQEAVTAIKKMWEEIGNDAELRAAAGKVNQLIVFDYTESGPGCAVWVDCRNGGFTVGAGIPEGNPDLTMSLSADDAHRSWSDKLNPVMAITRKKIRVKGSATGLLKLVPKLKKVAVIYRQVLTDLGMADKIMK
ncbi:MAG: SCP2 sterol-binding domain-containing protein [Spirochaetes bacterium]|nr:MAG: SCP2 sterol-binding domain-containing protein [Spirochaetota bacterium]